MFGANLVAKASGVMSVIILISIGIIYISGIIGRPEGIAQVYAEMPSTAISHKIHRAYIQLRWFPVCRCSCYHCTSLVLKNKKACTKAATIGILMNAIALALSTVMLLAWYDTGADSYLATGNTAVPTLYIAQQLGVAALPICYAIALCMCFISTAVTSIYGLILVSSRVSKYSVRWIRRRALSSSL